MKENKMKMYIPEIGDTITLKNDWTFDLYYEKRNIDLLTSINQSINSIQININDGGNHIVAPSDDHTYSTLLDYIYSKNVYHCGNFITSCVLNSSPKISKLGNVDINISTPRNNSGMNINHTFSTNGTYEYSQKIFNIIVDIKLPAISLPKGTELKIDRIYIRKGKDDYSSVTFYIEDCPDKTFVPKKKIRFWAKLSDVNTIMFD